MKIPTWTRLAVTVLMIGQASSLPDARGALDQDLLRDVERAVGRYAFLTVFDHVDIDIDAEGIVVISGEVTALDKRTAIGRRAASIQGVVAVRNDLDVLPVSRRDTELRYQIARAIYGSSTFWRYAARRNPPIHVLVRYGHVTLTGIVETETERAMAGVLASQFSTQSFTNRLRLQSEIRRSEVVVD